MQPLSCNLYPASCIAHSSIVRSRFSTFKRFHLQPIAFDPRKNKNSKNNSETIPQTPLLPKLAPENRPFRARKDRIRRCLLPIISKTISSSNGVINGSFRTKDLHHSRHCRSLGLPAHLRAPHGPWSTISNQQSPIKNTNVIIPFSASALQWSTYPVSTI